MSEQNTHGDLSTLPWPDGWRWTPRRDRDYQAKAATGVRTVEVEFEGAREPALLLPMRSVPRWQGIVFTVAGVGLLATAVLIGVVSVATQTWTGIVGVLVIGGAGTVFGLGGLAGLRSRKEAVAGLLLSPSRLIFDGSVDRLAMSWNDVAGFRLYMIRYGFRVLFPMPWHNWLSIDARDPHAVLASAGHEAAARLARRLKGKSVVAVADNRMIMSPLVAYHTLRYYLENPADRRELAGAEAVNRVHKGLLL
ncbi:hypothetical protein [Phytoactinopolyspora mesophila]|uniref:Uncharacterized protein n=1 Tax=Phytoactinopolyspora mesophila TaxID=2650750 RepID=A0A7K3LX16_9ACTN|nr:hypothetical protein [Phytoactinopolyspora mesophila]NDL55569.1 hypothetical protein [Phytoactinopolyspora mesophila]